MKISDLIKCKGLVYRVMIDIFEYFPDGDIGQRGVLAGIGDAAAHRSYVFFAELFTKKPYFALLRAYKGR